MVRLGDGPAYIGLGVLSLAGGAVHRAATAGEELALVVLSGIAAIKAGDKHFDRVGGRSDVFSGRGAAAYVPINTPWSAASADGRPVEIAVLSAKAERQFAPFVVTPDEVTVAHRGILNWQRDVHDIMTDNCEGRVDRIICGETFAYPGQWSSYPSHKHDTHEPPHEGLFEEIYLFKIKPAGGFGVQVMYSDDLSLREAYMLKDGDAAFLPRGYHPVGAAPGCQLYYLWVMAGPHGRKLVPRDDPNLAWMQNIAPMLK